MTTTEPVASESFGTKFTAFRRVLWNSEKKQLLGRDGMNWAKIGLFYFLFYACLAGFFAIMLAIVMQIIDRRIPTYTLDNSVLTNKGVNPGMGFRPQPNVERNLIKYKANQTTGDDGWGLFSHSLQRYLQDYHANDTVDESRYKNCSYESTLEERDINNGKSCNFDIRSFGEDDMPCVAASNYLYDKGQPCVVVKLNRIYDWMPVAYNDSVPKEISDYWREDRKDYVYMTCVGAHAADEDNIKEIVYYSPLNDEHIGGFPFYYYPYRNQPGYRQPLVFVHFKNMTKHVLINVECRAWAANIDHEHVFQRGSVHFEFLID